MRRALVLGDSLGVYFARDPLRAADALGLITRRAMLGAGTMVYLPPVSNGERAIVAVDIAASQDAIVHAVAIALGHLALGHHEFAAYIYGPDGPCFADVTEAQTAREFSRYFLSGVEANRQDLDRFAAREG